MLFPLTGRHEEDDTKMLAAQAYQVIGALTLDMPITPDIEKALDYFSGIANGNRPVVEGFLPFTLGEITFLINYNHSDDEHSPDWLCMELKAFSEKEALAKFEELKIYSSETIITRL